MKAKRLLLMLGRIYFPALIFFMLALGSFSSYAQPPSHDPSTMIRNVDGRYWIFTTGQGIWCMSSSNSNFTDWRPESTPFPANSWPGWISQYVSGFGGHFWAPDIIKIGNYYYLYYSCAGNGAPAAIGVTRATNLNGPWTDLGMVVAGNNAIDPAVYMDGGRLWMAWGNWQSGIDICELNPSTGKRLNSSSTHLVSGQVEAPGLIKNGSYYYLFYQRGLCCQGLNSGYYMVVARSTSITGPYTGERTFLPNRSGNEHGPGHFGYGEGKLTYHYYAVNDNGNAKLAIKTLGFSNGWPVVGGSNNNGGTTYYRIQNRGTGLFLDGMGRTVNGDACGQYANTTHVNAQWERISIGSYYQFRNRGTGLFLDGMGRTNNGADVGQWANTTHNNSQWSVQQYSGNYYRIQNRGTGLYLDGMGRTDNGSACGQYANTTHVNAQWQLIPISSSGRMAVEEERIMEEESTMVRVHPNPATDEITIVVPSTYEGEKVAHLQDGMGKVAVSGKFSNGQHTMYIGNLPRGMYILKIMNNKKLLVEKVIKQ